MISQAAAINYRKSKKQKIKINRNINLFNMSWHTEYNSIFKFNSNSEIKMDLINEVNSQFPTISFCFNPSISFSPNESITRLRFDRVDFNKTDLSLYFQEFIDPEYGSCWRFNKGYELLSSTSSGLSYGVRIDLYLDKQDTYDLIDVLDDQFIIEVCLHLSFGMEAVYGVQLVQ